MCGNGIRCTAKFFLEQTNINKKELNIDTRAGVKNIKINEDDTYSVNMGAPLFTITSDFPSEDKNIEGYNFQFVSMGNPHAVTFVDNLDNIDLKTIGPKVENNSHFPNKINVEFVEKISNRYYKVKVWERGCGETLACGTGACAVFAILNKFFPDPGSGENEITLEFPGGKLYLSKNHEDLNQSSGLVGRTSHDEVLGQIILRGPATFVFKGEITL
jgi:diaminopimelate epimerase